MLEAARPHTLVTRAAAPLRLPAAGIALAAILLLASGARAAGNCARTTTGLVPITELPSTPTMKYDGYLGGLYPGALNDLPASHETSGLFYAGRTVPRDASGKPDPAGRIGILTIGMSNARNESDAFVALAGADALRDPAVVAVNGAEGGASADVIRDPAHPYWSRVLTRVAQAGLTPEQVQALWVMDAVKNPTAPFPLDAEQLQQDLTAIVQILNAMFPNARLCFVSSRIYAGYAVTDLSPEPYAYESGFAVKWLIEAQINGAPELNYDPRRGTVAAPWLAWGPYTWADGLHARADGLTWTCTDFGSDGTHPSIQGSEKVGSMLVDFFRSDPVTASWYLRSAPTGVDALPPAGSWTIRPARPNPFTEGISIPLALDASAVVHAAVYGADGRRLRTLADGRLGAGTHTLQWDGRDDGGRATAPGVYFVRISGAGESRTAKVTRIR